MFRRPAARLLAQPQLKQPENGKSAKLFEISEAKEAPTPRLPASSALATVQARMSKLARHQAMTSLAQFFSGPVRNNLLISREVFRIIAREQKFLPSLQSWPQAKQAYCDAFNDIYGRLQRHSLAETIAQAVREATWGQVGHVLRRFAELGSFYYIGKLLGQATGYLIN